MKFRPEESTVKIVKNRSKMVSMGKDLMLRALLGRWYIQP